MQFCKCILIHLQSPSTNPMQHISTLPSQGRDPRNEAITSISDLHFHTAQTPWQSWSFPTPAPPTPVQPAHLSHHSQCCLQQPEHCAAPHACSLGANNNLAKAAQANLPSSTSHQQKRLHSRHLLQQGNLKAVLQHGISMNNSHVQYDLFICTFFYLLSAQDIFLQTH